MNSLISVRGIIDSRFQRGHLEIHGKFLKDILYNRETCRFRDNDEPRELRVISTSFARSQKEPIINHN